MRRFVAAALLALACFLAPPPEAIAQTTPEIRVKPLSIGDAVVSGFVLPPPAAGDRFILDLYDVSGQTPVFIDRMNVTGIDATSGAFSVKFAAPLGPNRRLDIGRVGGPAPVRAQTGTLGRPVLRATYDGARSVHGFVEDHAGVSAVRVRVMRSTLESQIGKRSYEQVRSTGDISDDGEFTVTLGSPLTAGQVVEAEALTATQVAGPLSEPQTVTDPGSWGRARAYFAAGVVFSKERGDFSEQDLAMTFVIDKGWLQRTDFQLPADPAVRKENKGQGQSTGTWTLRQLNTFLDTRLTSIPVVEPEPGAAPAAAPDFVGSRKGAVMQVGIYAPIYGPQTSWVHEGAVNTLFLTPVVRGGVQTIVGENGNSTTDIEGNPDDVFSFWSIGFGLGHQKLSGTTNQTPEVISYLHVTWGKAEAFKFKQGDAIVDPTRLMVEARLKIPDTPMQVGFDANLGQGHDDLRFVFGTRFDIGELFGRLKTFQ